MPKKKHIWAPPATGEVFTKPEVVQYMLNEIESIGILHKWQKMRVLEPSCGQGAFVIPLVQKLIGESPDWSDRELENYLKACDISATNIEQLRKKVRGDIAGCV